MVSSDFNGDGKSDLLWQIDNGQVAIWEMNGTTVIGSATISNPGPSWEVIGTGDFPWQRSFRHPVAERQRRSRQLGDERHQCHSIRQSRQSGAELACRRYRRLQR